MNILLALLLLGGSYPEPLEDDPYVSVVLEASAFLEGVDSHEPGSLFYEPRRNRTLFGAFGSDGSCTGVQWKDGVLTPLGAIDCPLR